MGIEPAAQSSYLIQAFPDVLDVSGTCRLATKTHRRGRASFALLGHAFLRRDKSGSLRATCGQANFLFSLGRSQNAANSSPPSCEGGGDNVLRTPSAFCRLPPLRGDCRIVRCEWSLCTFHSSSRRV